MTTLPDHLVPAFSELLLALADDKLMLGHCGTDWTGLGPILEEDIASSSIAQDEVAHASALYEFVGELRGASADALAFGRRPAEYRCATITVVPDDFDWGFALVRRLLCDHFDALRLARLSESIHEPIASLARRLADEEAVHLDHADAWLERLGHGTDESRQRVRDDLDRLLPLAAQLFEPTDGQIELEEAGLYPTLDRPMFDLYATGLGSVGERAGVDIHVPEPDPDFRGPRRGVHTDQLAKVLDEMCEVFRTAPEAAW